MSSLTDRTLDEKNEDRIDQLFTLFENLNERPDHTAEVELLMDRVTQLEAEVQSLTEQLHANDKMAKVDAIVEAAENKADAGMDAIVMTAKEIRVATGVSTSHAYRYIDELPEEFAHISARGDDTKERGVIVDLSHVGTKSGDSHA